MSQKFCSECGKQLPDNVKFCPFCGNSLIDNKDPNKETPFTPTTSKKKIPAWRIIVGVICGIIVIYELFAAVSDFKMANQIKDNQEHSAVEITESINPSPSPTTSSIPWEDDKKHAYEFDPVETPFKPIEKESLTQAITDACIDLNGKGFEGAENVYFGNYMDLTDESGKGGALVDAIMETTDGKTLFIRCSILIAGYDGENNPLGIKDEWIVTEISDYYSGHTYYATDTNAEIYDYETDKKLNQ